MQPILDVKFKFEICVISGNEFKPFFDESRNIYYINEVDFSKKFGLCAKSEFKRGHRKRMFSNENIQVIKKMRKDGISKNKIAKHFHCSEKTIRNYLK